MESYDLPEFKDWGIAAVKLLQGVLYSDENKAEWGLLAKSRDELQKYFSRIGLILVINEPEGYAFLRQIEEDDGDMKYQNLPRLFRRSRLSYEATMICILLRKRLHDFDERLSNLDDERCAIDGDELYDDWTKMIPYMPDVKKTKERFDKALGSLEKLQFVKQIGKTSGRWEIRRIIKARLPLENLENLLQQLQEYYQSLNESTTGVEANDD